MPTQRYLRCPNEFCTNQESGSVIARCVHCGKPFCYKLGWPNGRGCGGSGICPNCRRSTQRAEMIGYISYSFLSSN